MNTKPVSFAIGAMAAVFLSVLLSSCSLIGYGLGSATDASTRDTAIVATWNIDTIEAGTNVILRMRNGKSLEGTYSGLSVMHFDEYAKLFSESQSRTFSTDSLLELNIGSSVATPDGARWKCELVAYDLRGVWFRSLKANDPSPVLVSFARIKTVETDKGILTGSQLQDACYHSDVPLRSSIKISSGATMQLVNPKDVQQIEIRNSKHGALTGFLAGLVVDGVIIAAVASSSSHSSPPPPPSGTQGHSCPFVYSYDGSDYIFDSETFGGAIFKGLQRTDYSNLEHLAEVDGSYKLKMADELDETQYVDEIKLLVVDHPRGTKVIPTLEGKVLVLSDPQRPVEAKGYSGDEVLPLVSSRDDQWWISNPFGRDPDQTSSVRDGLTLTFNRPPEAKTVKLAFNVQNTQWASEIEKHLLELAGTDLSRWYERVNGSKEARDSFVKSVADEAMLAVKIWNGQSWSLAGHIWFVGPSISKTQVLEADISKMKGRDLKVQLESTAGLWMVNSAQADFTSDPPVKITEIGLEKATDHAGNDLCGVLGAVDDKYYVMSGQGEWASLSFKAMPKTSESERSFILKCSGYYTIHVNSQRQPQRELVYRLGNVPGAFGKYSIGILNRHLSDQLLEGGNENR